MTPLISPLDALDALRAAICPTPEVARPTYACAGRALAQPLRALLPSPASTQSAMDGWAVRHADLAAPLAVQPGQARAGHPAPALTPGHALRIFTGAALPEGADAVIRQEYTHIESNFLVVDSNKKINIWSDVRREGEDFSPGDSLLPSGERLHAKHIALAQAAGHDTLWVRERPVIHLLISGDELHAHTRDVNGPMLQSLLAQRGLLAAITHVGDDLDATCAALDAARRDAHLLVSTGGLSVGDHDHIRQAATRLGARWTFERVAQRPAKPLSLALLHDLPLLALPGPPPAALVGAAVFLAEALDALEGVTQVLRDAPLTRPASAYPHDWRWAPCRMERGALTPMEGARLLDLAQADALACLPPAAAPLEAGLHVRWWPL